MAEISVIIPVYNAHAYIDRCIESLLNQQFKDIEIILIDDGSNDGSAEICDAYADKDERVKVLHQQNQGVSTARNNGIEASTGRYLTFVDSDDYVEADYLQRLHDAATQSDADLVVSGWEYKTDDDEEREPYIYQADTLEKKDFLRLFEKHDFKHLRFLAGKLYRSECIKGKVHFEYDVAWSSPTIFIYKTLETVSKIEIIPYVGYIRYIHFDSASHKYKSFYQELKGFNKLYAVAQSMETSGYGKDIYKHVDLPAFLIRALNTLYRSSYGAPERHERLTHVHYDKKHIIYQPKTMKERIFYWALRNKHWGVIDRILGK